MTARHAEADEETPLLTSSSDPHGHHKRKHSPIPWGQFSVLLLVQLAEPLTSQVVYPFAPELIRNIGITHGDETRVAYYVGLIESVFFATQTVTVLYWSRISDLIGRKPVILSGLLGLSLSMYCFGLSRTFWGLVVSRCLNGALNGNIGVMKSMLAEVTDPSNIAQAYAYVPIAWSTGVTVGPMIGGSLSRPADRYPAIFGDSEFFKKYPYFLACSIPATFSIVACCITFFFLKETVRNPLSVRQLLRLSPKAVAIPNAPQTGKTTAVEDSSRPPPLRSLLTPPVLVASGNYACLAIVDISFRAIQPVFYSTPIELGGLGLDSRIIGYILSVYGIMNGLMQILFFGKVHDRFGTKRVYLAGLVSLIPVFAMFPIINECARIQGLSSAVWGLVVIQSLISIMISTAYGCVFIFITASSPNRKSLGTVNGLAQVIVSIMRTVGPATANSLFSLSIDKEHHLMGGYFVYYVLIALVCGTLYVGTLLPDRTMSDEETTETET